MIFLYIILGILLILSLVLFVPFTLRIYLSKSGKIILKYLFFRKTINLYGENKKKCKSKKDRSKTESPKKNKKNTDFLKNTVAEKGVLDGAIHIINIIKSVFEKLFSFVKEGRFTELNFTVNVSREQAGDTAIAYGGICAVAYPFIGFVNSNFTVKKENIDIKCSYLDKNFLDICFDATYKAKIYSLLKAVILFALDYNKISPENKNSKGS